MILIIKEKLKKNQSLTYPIYEKQTSQNKTFQDDSKKKKKRKKKKKNESHTELIK